MKLTSYRDINRRYFKSGFRPTEKKWRAAVESGELLGKIMLGSVYICEDYFLSRDTFNDPIEEVDIDLLN